MTLTITQWNCRGLITNIDDVHDLLEQSQPTVLCLQETRLGEKHKNVIRRYNVFRKDRSTSQIASGGVAIIVPPNIPAKEIQLNTNLEAIAVTIMMHRQVTLCSIYLPPGTPVTRKQLYNLLDEIPEPYILLGDFNAHNKLWGSTRTDPRGRLIEDAIIDNSLHLFNDGTPTYICPSTLKESSIDLSIGTANISDLFTWHVMRNPLGSDHYPVSLQA